MNITNEKTAELSELCRTQLTLESEIASTEEKLKQLEGQHRVLSEVTIPDLLMELGIETLKLNDGTKVECKTFYNASISEDNRDAAFSWLREHKFASLIKREVKCMFGMGEDEKANATVAQLAAQGLNPADKSSVHPSTLKSFVKEQIEGGTNLPTDLFGVFVGKRTKLTPAK